MEIYFQKAEKNYNSFLDNGSVYSFNPRNQLLGEVVIYISALTSVGKNKNKPCWDPLVKADNYVLSQRFPLLQ